MVLVGAIQWKCLGLIVEGIDIFNNTVASLIRCIGKIYTNILAKVDLTGKEELSSV